MSQSNYLIIMYLVFWNSKPTRMQFDTHPPPFKKFLFKFSFNCVRFLLLRFLCYSIEYLDCFPTRVPKSLTLQIFLFMQSLCSLRSQRSWLFAHNVYYTRGSLNCHDYFLIWFLIKVTALFLIFLIIVEYMELLQQI